MAVDPASDTTFHRPGMMPHAFAEPAGMLAANADRERAIDVLKAGFAESRLTKAEYEERTARVYAARTYGELGALVADLPAGPRGVPAHYPSPGYPSTGCPPQQMVRRTRQRGDGMARAGLILGWAGIALIAAIIAGMIVAIAVSGHSIHSVISHPVPVPAAPPIQGPLPAG